MRRALLLSALLTEATCHAKRALLLIDISIEQWAALPHDQRPALLSTLRHLVASDAFHLRVDSHLWMQCSPKPQSTLCRTFDGGRANS